MSAQLITAAAAVVGASIGLGGAILAAHVNGRNQRHLARAHRDEARREAERVACQSFLACLDIYLMVAEEIAWAKPGAKRSGGDADQATAELKAHYWDGWTAFLSANATLHLAARQDLGQLAAQITSHAYDIDGRIWNLTHGGQRIANDYEDTKNKLKTSRGEFISAVRTIAGSNSLAR